MLIFIKLVIKLWFHFTGVWTNFFWPISSDMATGNSLSASTCQADCQLVPFHVRGCYLIADHVIIILPCRQPQPHVQESHPLSWHGAFVFGANAKIEKYMGERDVGQIEVRRKWWRMAFSRSSKWIKRWREPFQFFYSAFREMWFDLFIFYLGLLFLVIDLEHLVVFWWMIWLYFQPFESGNLINLGFSLLVQFCVMYSSVFFT